MVLVLNNFENKEKIDISRYNGARKALIALVFVELY
jgi:hypothetical protein